jgi:hypothetical protein
MFLADGDALIRDASYLSSNISSTISSIKNDTQCGVFNIDFSRVTDATDKIAKNSLSIKDIIRPLIDTLTSITEQIRVYAITDKNITVFCIYGSCTLLFLLFLMFFFCRFKFGLMALIGLSEIIVIILTIVASVILFILQILSDVCVDPTGLILAEISNGTTTYTLALYYFNCIGTNHLAGLSAKVNSTIALYPKNLVSDIFSTFNGTINELQARVNDPNTPPNEAANDNQTLIAARAAFTTCSGYAVNLNDYVQTSLFEANNIVQDITNTLNCDSISKNWHDFVDTDLCSYNFDGIFIVCLVLYITAGFIYAIMCVSSVLYQYFESRYWNAGGAHFEPGVMPRKVFARPFADVEGDARAPVHQN